MASIAAMAAMATDIGGSAEQQDRGIIQTLPDGSFLAAVADGHGPHGGRAAQCAMDWIAEHATMPIGDAATFHAIDEHIHAQLLAHLTASGTPHMRFGRGIYTPGYFGTRGLPIRGGTTLSVVHVGADGAVRAAHVGDSDIHVFDDPAHGGSVEGVSLTGDHTPTSKTEYERIHDSHPGAEFICSASVMGLGSMYDRKVWTATAAAAAELNPAGPFSFSDVRGGWASYLRTSDDSEGLAMTRALGDFNLQLLGGVSTVPHCQELPALVPPPHGSGPAERVVVVASDGFWDIVHYAEAAEVIWRAENRDSAVAAAALMELAKAKTLERLGAPGDNITVSVIRVSVEPEAESAPEAHSLDDPALWEAAVTGVLPCLRPEDAHPIGYTPNGRQTIEGEQMLIATGAHPGTGVLYFGRGYTQCVLYRALDGTYWDIIYRRDPTNADANWRILGVNYWNKSHDSSLP
jgi:serine/threonine protein phosphatase PrpC